MVNTRKNVGSQNLEENDQGEPSCSCGGNDGWTGRRIQWVVYVPKRYVAKTVGQNFQQGQPSKVARKPRSPFPLSPLPTFRVLHNAHNQWLFSGGVSMSTRADQKHDWTYTHIPFLPTKTVTTTQPPRLQLPPPSTLPSSPPLPVSSDTTTPILLKISHITYTTLRIEDRRHSSQRIEVRITAPARLPAQHVIWASVPSCCDFEVFHLPNEGGPTCSTAPCSVSGPRI